jgi:hypothetical protein
MADTAYPSAFDTSCQEPDVWRGPDGLDALLWADSSPYAGRLRAVEPCQEVVA